MRVFPLVRNIPFVKPLCPATKKWIKKTGVDTNAPWFIAFQILRTMFLVLLGYVLFRSTTLTRAAQYFGAMFGLVGNAGVDAAALAALKNHASALILCAIASTPVVGWAGKKLGRLGSSDGLKNALCLVLLILSAAYIVSSSYNPFIYFAF